MAWSDRCTEVNRGGSHLHRLHLGRELRVDQVLVHAVEARRQVLHKPAEGERAIRTWKFEGHTKVAPPIGGVAAMKARRQVLHAPAAITSRQRIQSLQVTQNGNIFCKASCANRFVSFMQPLWLHRAGTPGPVLAF